MEIWVSRIYAKTLNYLRKTAGVWGDSCYLDNHEIISRYLDRVHERMTMRAKVPPRAFAMGHPSSFWQFKTPQGALENLIKAIPFDSLNPVCNNYFIDTDTASPENTPSNWQSQLQAGPLGNANMGAFKGVRFDSMTNAQTNLYPLYEDVCKGYEWAGVFEHSGATGHLFNFHSHIGFHGPFGNRTNVPLWTRIDTGFGGFRVSYYICHNRDKDDTTGWNNIAMWTTDTISETGIYELDMWFFKDSLNNSKNSVNVCLNGKIICKTKKVNMRGQDDGQWWSIHDSILINDTGVITVELTANYRSKDTVQDRAIADAVRLVHKSSREMLIIDNNDPGFILVDSLYRSYYSMLDDGGPSKVPFYVQQTCHANTYTVDDNLGLLYAMGHNGLMSIGSSNPNSGWEEYKWFLGAVGRGLSFGEAYLYMVNNHGGTNGGDKFILCGAGTLKAKPFRDYVDTLALDINNHTFTSDTLFVERTVDINSVSGSTTTIGDNVSLSITAGEDIIILPEFIAERGCEMKLSIDPTLKVQP